MIPAHEVSPHISSDFCRVEKDAYKNSKIIREQSVIEQNSTSWMDPTNNTMSFVPSSVLKSNDMNTILEPYRCVM
jgi:hypothetical protein